MYDKKLFFTRDVLFISRGHKTVMNLFAYDEFGKLISAKNASRSQDYFCLECKGKLRAKQGVKKIFHFFHIHQARDCRQSKKSLEHTMAQNSLAALLPRGESFLEKPFPEIGRVADVFWEKEKIVFEVQCSPISPFEVLNRIRDYNSIGLACIWILHEKRFGGYFKTKGWSLERIPHYYTNMTKDQEGFFYDRYLFKKRPVSLNKPQKIEKKQYSNWPKEIQNRLQNGSLFFEGDFVSSYLKEKPQPKDFFNEAQRKVYAAFRHLSALFHIVLKNFGWR